MAASVEEPLDGGGGGIRRGGMRGDTAVPEGRAPAGQTVPQWHDAVNGTGQAGFNQADYMLPREALAGPGQMRDFAHEAVRRDLMLLRDDTVDFIRMLCGSTRVPLEKALHGDSGIWHRQIVQHRQAFMSYVRRGSGGGAHRTLPEQVVLRMYLDYRRSLEAEWHTTPAYLGYIVLHAGLLDAIHGAHQAIVEILQMARTTEKRQRAERILPHLTLAALMHSPSARQWFSRVCNMEYNRMKVLSGSVPVTKLLMTNLVEGRSTLLQRAGDLDFGFRQAAVAVQATAELHKAVQQATNERDVAQGVADEVRDRQHTRSKAGELAHEQQQADATLQATKDRLSAAAAAAAAAAARADAGAATGGAGADDADLPHGLLIHRAEYLAGEQRQPELLEKAQGILAAAVHQADTNRQAESEQSPIDGGLELVKNYLQEYREVEEEREHSMNAVIESVGAWAEGRLVDFIYEFDVDNDRGFLVWQNNRWRVTQNYRRNTLGTVFDEHARTNGIVAVSALYFNIEDVQARRNSLRAKTDKFVRKIEAALAGDNADDDTRRAAKRRLHEADAEVEELSQQVARASASERNQLFLRSAGPLVSTLAPVAVALSGPWPVAGLRGEAGPPRWPGLGMLRNMGDAEDWADVR
jgi:hypothetical protein